MSQRHYSSYLSRLDGSNSVSPYEKSTPTARIRQTYSSSQDDKYSSTLSNPYRSSYLSNEETRDDRRHSPMIQTKYQRSYVTERRAPKSSPNRPYNRIDKFSSDVSVSTNLLHEAINNALDDASRFHGENHFEPTIDPSSRRNKMRSQSRDRDYHSVNNHVSNYRGPSTELISNNNHSYRQQSPLREFVPKVSRPVSPLDDRTISNVEYKTQPTSQFDGEASKDFRYSPSRNDSRTDYNQNSDRQRDDSAPFVRRRHATSQSPYRPRNSMYSDRSEMDYNRRDQRESYRGSQYFGFENESVYSSRRRENHDDKRRDDYNDRRRPIYNERRIDNRSNSTGRFDRNRDSGNHSRDEFSVRDERRRERDSYNDRRMPSRPRDESVNVSNPINRNPPSAPNHRFIDYESNPNQFSQRSEFGTMEEKRSIVINVHSGPSTPQESNATEQISINYDDVLASDKTLHQQSGDQLRQRGGLPPRMPMPNDISKLEQNASNDSDLSSVTGFHKTPQRVKKTRSIISNASGLSKWKNDDVVLLPKGEARSEAAIAATAAASVIVNDERSTGSFETAVKSVSNILKKNKAGDEDAVIIVRPSISHTDFDHLTDDSVVPISFHKVTENMKEAMKAKSKHQKVTGVDGLNVRIESSDFFARCAMLAATAIMKANPVDKAIIAQTAAETILSFHVATRSSKDWLDSAENELKNVASEVSNAVNSLPVQNNEAMASLASIAVLSEGGKSLALERIRQRFQPNVDIEVIEETPIKVETVDEDEIEEDEDDLISPIRAKGSLMDLDSDDSNSDDGKEVINPVPTKKKNTIAKHNQSSNSRSMKNTDSAARIQSLSKSFDRETTQSNSNDSREQMRNAVNKLLASPSGEMLDEKPRHISGKKSALDKKQDEIAKRIQRIQMRAAGKTDEEINEVLGAKRTFSSENLMKSTAQNFDDMRLDSDTTQESELPSAQDVLNGIGTVFAPVVSYLGGLNMPSNVSSMIQNMKMPALPQCKMEDGEFKIDEFESPMDEIRVEEDKRQMGRIQSQQRYAPTEENEGIVKPDRAGKNNDGNDPHSPKQNTKEMLHPLSIVEGPITSPPSGLTDDDAMRYDKSRSKSPIKMNQSRDEVFRNPGQRSSFTASYASSSDSSNSFDEFDDDEVEEPMKKSNPLPRRTITSNSAQNKSIYNEKSSSSITNNNNISNNNNSYRRTVRTRSTDSGAFSAALDNGDFSNIPMQKLSLVPPSSSGIGELETNKNLFFSSDNFKTPGPGATEMYSNAYGMKNTGSSGEKQVKLTSSSTHDDVVSNSANSIIDTSFTPGMTKHDSEDEQQEQPQEESQEPHKEQKPNNPDTKNKPRRKRFIMRNRGKKAT